MLYLLLPLASAILYPVGNLFFKRSIHEGGGVLRVLFLSNLVLAACFMPLLLFVAEPPDWSQFGWPLLTSACFFFGQGFTLIAIQSGHVSVQTPLMGMKLIFVAAFSALLKPDDVPPHLWVGATICTLGIFLIGGGSLRAFRRSGRTVVLTLVACLLYGAADTLTSYRSAGFGKIPFVIAVVSTVALLSFGLVPFFKSRLRDLTRHSVRLMTIGGIASGVQAVLLTVALSQFGHATSINIIYSSRALFGVLLVWLLGAKLGNTEASDAGAKVMRNRLLGSLLLCAAIVLVFM